MDPISANDCGRTRRGCRSRWARARQPAWMGVAQKFGPGPHEVFARARLTRSADEHGRPGDRQADDNQPRRECAGARETNGIASEVRIADGLTDAGLTDQRGRQRTKKHDRSDRERDSHARQRRRKPGEEEECTQPADDGYGCHEPQTYELALTGLTHQLEPQRTLGALSLGFNLLPFEVEPAAIAFEGFPQGGDDNAGKGSLERAEGATANGQPPVVHLIEAILRPARYRKIGHADDRAQNTKPRNSHAITERPTSGREKYVAPASGCRLPFQWARPRDADPQRAKRQSSFQLRHDRCTRRASGLPVCVAAPLLPHRWPSGS